MEERGKWLRAESPGPIRAGCGPAERFAKAWGADLLFGLKALRRKNTWVFVATLFGILAVFGALGAYVCERMLGEVPGFPAPLAGLFIGLLLPTAFFAVYIAEGITKLTEEKEVPVIVKTFDDPIEAAQFRLSTVMQIKADEITSEIYCTSHCNLFANPGGSDGPTNARLRAINDTFFGHLMDLTMNTPAEEEGLKLLLQYRNATDDEVKKELGQRLGIYARACAMRRDVRLSRDRFEIRHLLPHSLKDYFVIEDHLFKTVRKTQASGGRTQYVYMQSREIANTYRMWLADVFEHGHEIGEGDAQSGQTPLTEDDAQLSALINTIWADVLAELALQA
jgi:hypothetical protein